MAERARVQKRPSFWAGGLVARFSPLPVSVAHTTIPNDTVFDGV